jgi:hypothetical protein
MEKELLSQGIGDKKTAKGLAQQLCIDLCTTVRRILFHHIPSLFKKYG